MEYFLRAEVRPNVSGTTMGKLAKVDPRSICEDGFLLDAQASLPYTSLTGK